MLLTYFIFFTHIISLKENSFDFIFIIIVILVIILNRIFNEDSGGSNYSSEKITNSNSEDDIYYRTFDQFTTLNEKSLMEATISLTITMLFKERADFPKKIAFIKKYFYKKFTSSNKYFPDLFSHNLKAHYSIESVCYWLTKKMPSNQDRINILYFVAGISMVDGSISKKEHDLLIQIQELLNLERKDLDSIIAMFTKHEDQKKEQEEKYSISNNERRTKARIEIYCAILETPPSSTFDEIKKAHRKLVMLNHPDKYEKAGMEMVNLAKERFIKIQEAYEFLEKIHMEKNK